MSKPLTLSQARPLLKALFRDDRIVFKDGPPAAFFNEGPEARFWGDTWEDVLESALKTKYLTEKELGLIPTKLSDLQ